MFRLSFSTVFESIRLASPANFLTIFETSHCLPDDPCWIPNKDPTVEICSSNWISNSSLLSEKDKEISFYAILKKNNFTWNFENINDFFSGWAMQIIFQKKKRNKNLNKSISSSGLACDVSFSFTQGFS